MDALKSGNTKLSKQNKVLFVKDHYSREARVNVDEMRMQIQTQLDTYGAEHLLADEFRRSGQEFNYLPLMVNVRTISQYNFEQLKEKLKGFTKSVIDQTDALVQEYEPFTVQDGVAPSIEAIPDDETPSLDDLNREMALLEREVAQAIDDTVTLKKGITQKLQAKAEKNKATEKTYNHSNKVLEGLEEWMDMNEEGEKKQQRVVLIKTNDVVKPVSERDMKAQLTKYISDGVQQEQTKLKMAKQKALGCIEKAEKGQID